MTDQKSATESLSEFDREAILLAPGLGQSGPFSLDDDAAYQRWRARKLEEFPKSVGDLVVEVGDMVNLTPAETEAIRDRVRRAGMAVYKSPAQDDVDRAKDDVRALAGQFGMTRLDRNPYADEDAITPLHVAAGQERLEQGRKMYIPYTNRAISWHTDGYYNTPSRRIRAMVLHCVRQAGGDGGENALFDPEMAYLLMRDVDPAMVAALCRPLAMTIPANDMDDEVVRGDVGGPVFSLNSADNSLYMRYTARKRNIVWADDDDTRRAVDFLTRLLDGEEGGEPYIFRHRMSSGEGLLCNNVLHTRTGFANGGEPGGERMMLRARYLDRVAGTA
ncbi:MAG: TauD/TfdA family dioxygenase [Alphaproteobacteria bacterium]|nr:TauD/TfdA family dioxygenase [Alphaproteobacteria bacterium]